MVERLLLLLLVIFAILAVQQGQLRVAVIFLSFFSLVSSLVYLLRSAPDVAMAEAAIGTTIAVVLYLVTLRKQEWIRTLGDIFRSRYARRNRRVIVRHRVAAAILVVAVAALFFFLLSATGLQDTRMGTVSADAYRTLFRADTGADNAVTAIYLQYRMYDTIFETLVLLVSVMGVVFFSRQQLNVAAGTLSHSIHPGFFRRHQDQQVTSSVIGLLYPVVFMIGMYIILSGHRTPGGGFQGGAVLAAVLIIRYLSLPHSDIRIHALQTAEKLLFLLIIVVPVVYLFFSAAGVSRSVPYLILMNTLIGIKVACGISVVFYRFVFFESR